MKSIAIFATVALSTLSALSAQAGLPAPDGSTQINAESDSSLEQSLVGDYSGNEALENGVPLYALSLKADGTYTAQGGCALRPKSGFARCFAIEGFAGTWSVEMSGPELGAPEGAPELVLVSQFDGTKTTFFYSIEEDTLTLNTALVGSGAAFERRAN